MLQRMMECSELRVSEVARFEQGYSRQVASRVLESAHAFQQWTVSHSQVMRQIAVKYRTSDQMMAVKRTAMSMVHRKAPFEFLRDHHICGAARHRFFDVLYGPHDFARAMVQEYQNYLVASCSYLCVDRLCSESTMDLIGEYEKAYTAYWQAHTAALLESQRATARSERPEMLQILGEELRRVRDSLLGAAPSRADQLTLEELCRPTGDTVRMDALLEIRTTTPGRVKTDPFPQTRNLAAY